MRPLVIDSGAMSQLAARSRRAGTGVDLVVDMYQWSGIVPSVVLVECMQGKPHTDVLIDRFLKSCELRDRLPYKVARRAATLRARAGRGSAVDAVVVAMAEPGGTVLTTDPTDCRALAAYAQDVEVLAA